MRGIILILAALSVPGFAAAPKPPDISFARKTLDLGANEAAAIFDVNSTTLQVTLTAFAAGALSDLVLDSPGAIPAGFVIGTASVNPR